MSNENVEKFISEISKSLSEETFVKMTLGNYKGADEQLQKLFIRLIKTRKGKRLYFLYRYQTRDTAKNYSFDEGIHILNELLGKDFHIAHLFTTANDFQLDVGKRAVRLNVGKPTFTAKPPLNHDRKKKSRSTQTPFS